jgi:hypothetical protein
MRYTEKAPKPYMAIDTEGGKSGSASGSGPGSPVAGGTSPYATKVGFADDGSGNEGDGGGSGEEGSGSTLIIIQDEQNETIRNDKYT